MSLFKPTLHKMLLWPIIGVGLFMVCARNHVIIFPCEVTTFNAATNESQIEESTCTIQQMSSLRDDGKTATLTSEGWLVSIGLFVVLSFFLGFGVGHLSNRSSRREKL